MTGLDVLREEQDAELRIVAAETPRHAGAVVVVVRRHPDVDDCHVGLRLVNCGLQRDGIADLGHDVVAGVGEQPREALAEQRRVLTDHDAARHHGLDDRTAPVGGSRAPTHRRAACTRSLSPARPEPAAGVAPPRPSSLIRTSTWPSRRAMQTSILVASACLTALAIASLAT